MKLYSWNVNGIRAVMRKDAFMPLINEHRPDVLCLQETKAQPDQIDLPEVKNDYHITLNSAQRKGYAGTAILSRQKPLNIIRDIPEGIAKKHPLADQYGDTNSEGRVLAVELNDFWVVNVYTPNAKEDLSRIPMRQAWDPAFLELLQNLEAKGKPVLACGDFNVAHTEDDLARPKPNIGKKGFTAEERSGFDAFISAGYVDTLRKFTKGNGHYSWWSHWGKARENNVGWRIDYWLASQGIESQVKSSKIHPDVAGSDHCPVSIEI